ncbi:MAG: endo-1,4-beta-xylanase [Kiritimatiellae bacterium]|nr:endo-1,4-beta-xylanase [Kiritimatiellia bacterium]
MDRVNRELCDLVEQYLEGTLDTAGRAALLALIGTDPRAARLLARELDLSMLLAEIYEVRDFTAHAVHEMLRAATETGGATHLARIQTRPGPGRHGVTAKPGRFVRTHRTRGRRVRRPVVAPIRSRRAPILWLAAAASVAVIVGFYLHSNRPSLFSRRASPYARLSATGEVVIRRGDRVMAAGQDTALLRGDEIQTAGGARASLLYPGEATRLDIASTTRLSLHEATGKRINLTAGRIEATVARQPEARPMVFVTPIATAKVVGTRLMLLAEQRSTRVEVMTGTVFVTRKCDGASVRVSAAHYVEVRQGVDLKAEAIQRTGAGTATRTGGLRDFAAELGIRIGTSVGYELLTNDPAYRAAVAREFNVVTPENEMKWEFIHPQRDRFDFRGPDSIVNFAQANGMTVHGHALVMRDQNPKWLTSGRFTRNEMIDILRRHIHTVVGRYRGKVAVWDVTNNALAGSGERAQTVWHKRIGPDHIAMAFHFAHEADPHARLICNDHDAEDAGTPKAEAFYALVRDLLREGVPIHGVGFHVHVRPQNMHPRPFADNIARFAALGLDVYVTQMDVRLREPVSEADLVRQAEIYRAVMDLCLTEPACKELGMWGFTDKHSWIPTYYPGWGQALVLDASYKPKPAYDALRQRLTAGRADNKVRRP